MPVDLFGADVQPPADHPKSRTGAHTIHAMYHKHGVGKFGLHCGDCAFLNRVQVGHHHVFKCKIAGDTASAASDFRKYYQGCGLWQEARR